MSTPPIRFSAQARDALARDRLIEAIKHVRDDNDLGLRQAKQAVDAWLAGRRDFDLADAAPPTSSTTVTAATDHDADSQVRDLLDRGLVIEAIRRVREVTGLGLKDAKDWVDARRLDASLPLPTRVSADDLTPPGTSSSPPVRRYGTATVQRDHRGRSLAWLLPLLSLVSVLAWWLTRTS